MINAVQNQPAEKAQSPQQTQSSQAPTPPAPPSASQSPAPEQPRQTASRWGLKAILSVVGLTAFLVMVMAAVLISQRQRLVSEPVAPTAPVSVPEATEEPDDPSCTLTFSVDPFEGTAECVSKEAFTGFSGQVIIEPVTGSVNRGDQFVYLIEIRAEETTPGPVTVTDQLPAFINFVDHQNNTPGDYDFTTNIATFEFEAMSAGQVEIIEFMVEVGDDAPLGSFENSVTVITNDDESMVDVCAMSLNILPDGTAECIAKEAFTSFSGDAEAEEIPAGSVVERGDELVYRVELRAEEPTFGDVVVFDQLPEQVVFVEHDNNSPEWVYDAESHTLTANIGELIAPTEEEEEEAGEAIIGAVLEFLVRVDDQAEGEEFVNHAEITTGDDPASINECEIVLNLEEPEEPIYACDSPCTTDAQCQTVNASYVCSADHGNVCRLDDNRDDPNCQPPAQTYACNSPCDTNAQCQTANANYICYAGFCRLDVNPEAENCLPEDYTPPPPAPGCNELCETNADCADDGHICWTIEDGTNRCRLAEYVNSETCTLPPAKTAYPHQPIADQPDLPERLPESGPAEWMNLLQLGLVVLGVGAVLLLLL